MRLDRTMRAVATGAVTGSNGIMNELLVRLDRLGVVAGQTKLTLLRDQQILEVGIVRLMASGTVLGSRRVRIWKSGLLADVAVTGDAQL